MPEVTNKLNKYTVLTGLPYSRKTVTAPSTGTVESCPNPQNLLNFVYEMKVAYMMAVEVKIHSFLTSALQSEWPA